MDDPPVFRFQRRVAHKIQIPVFRVMQVGKTTIHQRPHVIERESRMLVSTQHELRISGAFGQAEARTVDQVTAIARQSDAVASLDVGRTGFGVLACHPADADDALLEAMHQHQAHLQEDLEFVGDRL